MANLEAITCPNCGAPLEVEPGVDPIRCEYCRVQSSRNAPPTDVRATPAGPVLAATVSVEVTEDLGVAILAKGAPLPLTKTETFTTSRDDQESFQVKLCVGDAERPADNERLASFSVPLVARGHRGTVVAGVTFHVAADGTARIAVKERGVDAPVVRDGLRLPVA